MLDMGKTLGLVLVSQDLLVSVLILHNNRVCPKSPVMCQHTLCSQENDLYHGSHGTSVQWPISALVHCTAANFSLSTPYSRPIKSPRNLGLLNGQGYRVPRLKLATVYLYSVLRLISVAIADHSYDCLVVVEPHLDLGGMMKSNFFFFNLLLYLYSNEHEIQSVTQNLVQI